MTQNGTYRLFNDDGTSYVVFCQFNAHRSGLAFPTKNAIEHDLLNLDVLWTNRTYVGIYLWLADGKEYETLIRPLANEESTTRLTVATSWQAPLPSADNSAGPYIYFSMNDTVSTATPASSTSRSGT